MTDADIPAADRLRQSAHFNQSTADWARLLRWAPGGCFVAVDGADVVGSITTTRLCPTVAWVGMVLVDPRARRRGIARALLRRALTELAGSGTIGLDATPAGRPLYESEGFSSVGTLSRWRGDYAPDRRLTDPTAVTVRGMVADDLPAVVEHDAAATGFSRRGVLEDLFAAHPDRSAVAYENGELGGFALGRPGAHAFDVGPVVATGPDIAADLVDLVCLPSSGHSIVIDLPDNIDGTDRFGELLRRRGLTNDRPFTRMVRDGDLPAGRHQRVHAIIGPEIG